MNVTVDGIVTTFRIVERPARLNILLAITVNPTVRIIEVSNEDPANV